MLIKVKVFPNSKKEEVIERGSNKLEIKIKEKPVEGRANERTIEVLSSFLKIPAGKIRLIRGTKQRNKIFEIKDID